MRQFTSSLILYVLMFVAVTPANALGIDFMLYDIQYSLNKVAIEYLYNKGIISGYPDKTFRPDNPINRAELLKILVGDRISEVEHVDEWGTLHPDYQNCFSDVHDEWFAPYVCLAKKKGWIDGYPDGSFQPSQYVNRAEAIKMLVAIEGYPTSNQVDKTPFDDVDTQAWYAPYIHIAFGKGILELDRGDFGVSMDMTRGSISESMYRVAMMQFHNTEKYTQTNELPSVEQVRSGVMLPINLMNNQVWEIELEVSKERFIKVQRNEDSFDVTIFSVDPNTGKRRKGFLFGGQFLNYDYRAEFEDRRSVRYLTMYECSYFYPYLKLDARCNYYSIPAVINKSVVQGYNAKPLFIDEKNKEDFKVRIISKAKKEIECNVKGQEHSRELIYYTQDSEAMRLDSWRGVFKCFETEEDARRLGYKKSYK